MMQRSRKYRGWHAWGDVYRGYESSVDAPSPEIALRTDVMFHMTDTYPGGGWALWGNVAAALRAAGWAAVPRVRADELAARGYLESYVNTFGTLYYRVTEYGLAERENIRCHHFSNELIPGDAS